MSSKEIKSYNENNTDQTTRKPKGKESLRSRGAMRSLGPSFVPGPFDVICARGAAAFCHPGNRRFRDIIEMSMQQYSEAKNKMEKSAIVSTIVASIREVNPQGRFIKEKSGEWFEVSDSAAREKVGQNLRDALHTMYRSSSKAKQDRLKACGVPSSNAYSSNNVLPSYFQESDNHALLESHFGGNSAEALSRWQNQALDVVPTNAVVANTENCDCKDFFPNYNNEDGATTFLNCHDDARIMASKTEAPVPSDPELDQFTLDIISSILLCPDDWMDDAMHSDIGIAAGPAADPAVELTVDQKQPGILHVGGSVDKVFGNEIG